MNWLIPTPWGPIPVHFCQHEMMAILATLPFIGGAWLWTRSKFKKHENCCHDHLNDREHKVVAHPEKSAKRS